MLVGIPAAIACAPFVPDVIQYLHWYGIDPARGRARDALLYSEYASIQTLDRVPENLGMLRLNVGQGRLAIQTLRNLERSGAMQSHIAYRKVHPPTLEDPPDVSGTPEHLRNWEGSGYIIYYQGRPYLMTAEHVLKHCGPSLLHEAEMDKDVDIAAMPLNQEHSREPGPLPVCTFDYDMTDRTLHGRRVRIVGLGSDLFDIQGEAVYWPVCNEHGWYAPCPHQEGTFILKFRPEQLPNRAVVQGESGGPVFDAETGLVVGTLHSTSVQIDSWYCLSDGTYPLVRFAGPDAHHRLLGRFGGMQMA